MTNYTINHIEVDGHTYWTILNNDSNEYFNGYDFMGSVNWTPCVDICYWMSKEEAMEICRDLNLADEPAEPAKQDDPMMEMFQRALDAAVIDRDDYGHQWSDLVKTGKSDASHRMFIRYQQAQGFLEGLTNGIFIAGYNILSTVDSTKMIVTK